LYRAVDLGSALSPGHVTGRVVGMRPGVDLAVAVNGRVAAVTRTFDVEGSVRFAAFAPDSAFRNGANDVEVFVVRRDGSLAMLPGGTGLAESYRLVGDRLMRGGRALPLVPGAFQGRVENWFFEPATVRIGGWSADLHRKRIPDEIVVFADGRFFFSGATTVGRRNLAQAYGRKVAVAGFVFDLPRRAIGTGRHELRFFAVKGGEATELKYPAGFPWK
jgi:hypothetical protein